MQYHFVRARSGNKSTFYQRRFPRCHGRVAVVRMKNVTPGAATIPEKVAMTGTVLSDQARAQNRVAGKLFPGSQGTSGDRVTYGIIGIPEIIGGVEKIIPSPVF